MADEKQTAAERKVEDFMPLQSPPESSLEFAEREPKKVIPTKGSDGADTPSGHALRAVGAPKPEDAGSEKERQRGLEYLYEKYKKRWLG